MLENFCKKVIKLSAIESLNIWVPKEYSEDISWLLDFWHGDYSSYSMVQQSKQATVLKGKIPGYSSEVYLKKLHIRKKVDLIKNIFRKSRGYRATEMGFILEKMGFNTPETIFFMESTKFGIVCESGMVTIAIENAPSAAEWLMKRDLTQQPRREFIKSFARLIANWHKAGLHHGDLRLGNVLAKLQDKKWKFYFLDNERNSIKLPIRKSCVIHNLMQINMYLNIPNSEKLRFWHEYNKVVKFNRKESREIIQCVETITQSRMQNAKKKNKS